MSKPHEIDRVFSLATEVCPKCRGSRSVSNPDGSYSPCHCVIKEMIMKYLGELKRYKALKDTPLAEPLIKGHDIVIEFDESRNLYAHLKTALLIRKSWVKSWKIITPDEVMSRSFSAEHDLKKDLYQSDLLVIMASAFPYYEAAGKQHEYVIKTRQSLGKTTWFCTSNIDELFKRSDLPSLTTSFKAMLSGIKKVRIYQQMTLALLKDPKNNVRKESELELGSSVLEVNRDLLDFDDPVWNRITT